MPDRYDKLYERISELLPIKSRILIGIEGGCASGKTTFANEIQRMYDCNVFHMDDFFLRPEQQTPERFAEIGGNIDYERFHDEILLALLDGEMFEYRPYDCKTGTLKEPVKVHPMWLNIIEGTYSLHPQFAFAYDIAVFLEVSDELQRAYSKTR